MKAQSAAKPPHIVTFCVLGEEKSVKVPNICEIILKKKNNLNCGLETFSQWKTLPASRCAGNALILDLDRRQSWENKLYFMEKLVGGRGSRASLLRSLVDLSLRASSSLFWTAAALTACQDRDPHINKKCSQQGWRPESLMWGWWWWVLICRFEDQLYSCLFTFWFSLIHSFPHIKRT